MYHPYQAFWRFVEHDLWTADLSAMPRGRRWVWTGLRMFYVLVRELTEGQLALHAMSLVYTTLLSLVPLLAVSFSALKAFGVHNQIEPLLLNLLEPLGEQGEVIAGRIIGFVEQMQVGVLGSVGLAFLLYTVVTLIQKVEFSFNYVWRVKQVRSFPRRFSDYLSVIIIGPVLVFSAIGLTASIMNYALVQQIIAIEPFGTLVLLIGRLMPYLLITAAFTFVYMFVPNTNVRFSSALVGGFVGGVLWQVTGYAFAVFASSSARYDAIYSGFAIVILAMIWLYLSWFILLFGSQIAYYHQHPQQIRRKNERIRFNPALRERVGLALMYLVALAYERGEQGWSMDALTERLAVPGDALADVLDDLLKLGFLAETSGATPLYLPGRDPERLPVSALLSGLRTVGEEQIPYERAALALPAVDTVLGELHSAAVSQLSETTLADLVRGEIEVVTP